MVVAFNQPDDYTTLHLSHFYKTDIKEYESSVVVGLKWSPDGSLLASGGLFTIFNHLRKWQQTFCMGCEATRLPNPQILS